MTEFNAPYMRAWTVATYALFTIKGCMDLPYQHSFSRAEVLDFVFWMMASCAFILFTHIRYPLVRNGIFGFKYPYDLLAIAAILGFLAPNLAIYIQTETVKRNLIRQFGISILQLSYSQRVMDMIKGSCMMQLVDILRYMVRIIHHVSTVESCIFSIPYSEIFTRDIIPMKGSSAPLCTP